MLFKNLQVFKLHPGFLPGAQEMNAQLERGRFVPCGNQDPASRGWVSPRSGDLVHMAGGQWLLCLQSEVRLLPADVVNAEVKKRAAHIAEEQGYPPGRKALRELKDRVTEDLLPAAFRRQRKTHVWIDPVNGWLGVDASSSQKAEDVLEHLRLCLDTLPLSLVNTNKSPVSAMSDWLASGEPPEGFTIDKECEVKATDETKAMVRYVRHSLDGEDVRTHLAAGKFPTRLGMTWDDRLSMVLTEKFEIKRLAFLELAMKDAYATAQDMDEEFDADLVLMAGEFGRLLPALVNALGGYVPEPEE